MLESIKKERPKDISRACRVMATSRSSMAYRSVKDDLGLMENLRQLAEVCIPAILTPCSGQLTPCLGLGKTAGFLMG
jgi:hypothetical protein